mmetsp:Transcript_23043/g.62813  ORF Transcript_23043/g.62813 Transcript_23043/m.62813 type:complete len:282 (+) Transcript_23043:498-1343(+)
MSGVWKAPEPVTSLAWSAPLALTSFSSFSMAALLPPQVAPFGKRAFATWQTVPEPISSRTCLQKPSSLSRFSPATDNSACAPPLVDASAMASDRTFMIFSPSSKDMTPAATSAAYSPTPRPATAPGRPAASGASSFNFSKAARPAMNMTGWQTSVFSSFDAGPFKHTSSASQPRMPLALLSRSLTPPTSFTFSSIFTYCEPCPGKSRPTGMGGSLGMSAAFGAATTISGSSSSSSGSGPVPYFMASKPHVSAAPGRLEKKPFAGFLPNSWHLYCLALAVEP